MESLNLTVEVGIKLLECWANSHSFQADIQEVQRLEKSLKDDKFKELFLEYVQEISDPKNREVMTFVDQKRHRPDIVY